MPARFNSNDYDYVYLVGDAVENPLPEDVTVGGLFTFTLAHASPSNDDRYGTMKLESHVIAIRSFDDGTIFFTLTDQSVINAARASSRYASVR